MSKIQKKQYIQCPQCHNHTRLRKISVPLNSFNFLNFAPALKNVAINMMKSQMDTTDEKCGHCGATENLQKVFLDTEVEKKKEIAFITPAGERVEVGQ
jgi:hypothetical protein